MNILTKRIGDIAHSAKSVCPRLLNTVALNESVDSIAALHAVEFDPILDSILLELLAKAVYLHQLLDRVAVLQLFALVRRHAIVVLLLLRWFLRGLGGPVVLLLVVALAKHFLGDDENQEATEYPQPAAHRCVVCFVHVARF